MEPRIDPVRPRWLGRGRYSSGWLIAIGAMLVALGVLAIILPYAASLTTILVIGWILLIGAVVQLVHAIQDRAGHGVGWALLAAFARGIAGVLLIANPHVGKLLLTAILATYFLVVGVVMIARAMAFRALPAWGWVLFDGIVSVVLGILVWSGFPATATWIIGLFVGIEMVMAGVSAIALGFSLRSYPRHA